MRAGASITWRSCGTAETLMTLRPRLPVSSFRPPVGLKGSLAGRTTEVSREAPMSCHASLASFAAVGTVSYTHLTLPTILLV